MSDLAFATCKALHDWAALRVADAKVKPTARERLALLRALELSEEFLGRVESIPENRRSSTRSSFEFNTEDFGKAVTFQMPRAGGAGSAAAGLLELAGGSFAWAFARRRLVPGDGGRVHPSDEERVTLLPYAVRLTHAARYVLTGTLTDSDLQVERTSPAWIADDEDAPEYPLGLGSGNGDAAITLLAEMEVVARRATEAFEVARRTKSSDRQRLRSVGTEAQSGLGQATEMLSRRFGVGQKKTMGGAALDALLHLPREDFAAQNAHLSANEAYRRASLVEGGIAAALAVAHALNHATTARASEPPDGEAR